MFFIARICSVVRGTSGELLCAGAGVSVVSMGVWLPGDSLDSAMMAGDQLRIVTREAYFGFESRCCSVAGIGRLQLLMFHIWCLLACFLRLCDCVSCKHEDVFQSKEKPLTRQMAEGQKDRAEMS